MHKRGSPRLKTIEPPIFQLKKEILSHIGHPADSMVPYNVEMLQLRQAGKALDDVLYSIFQNNRMCWMLPKSKLNSQCDVVLALSAKKAGMSSKNTKQR